MRRALLALGLIVGFLLAFGIGFLVRGSQQAPAGAESPTAGWCCMQQGTPCQRKDDSASCMNGGGNLFDSSADVCNAVCTPPSA